MSFSENYNKLRKERIARQAAQFQKAEQEKYTSEIEKLTAGYDPTTNSQEGQTGWNDYVATQERIAQNKKQAQEKKTWWEALLGYLGDAGQDTSLPIHTTQQVTKGYQEQEAAMQRPDDRWSDEQKYAFGYLWNQDRQSAYQYAYAVNNMLNTQQEQAKIQQIQDAATDNFGAGAAHTVGAILSAPSGMADYLGDIIAQGALGYIPEADGQVSPFEYSQAVTGGISQKLNKDYGTLNEKIPIIGGKGLGDVYGLGTSIAQSSLAAFAGGSGQALVQFFGSSAAAGVDDALSRGAEGNKAVAYGTMLGLAEGLAEMIGVDNLMKIGASDTLRQLVNNLLKQGAAEGIEEGVTAILNNFTDNLVMGNKSNFYALVKQFMANGMSEAEAKRHAWTALAEGVAFDMLGGFVSGAAHAAPQTAYQTYRQKQSGAGKNTATQKPQQHKTFIDDILDMVPNRKNTATESRQSAERASQDYVNSLLDEVTAKATGAPADPIGAAVEAFKTTGTVTDKAAADILGSIRAVSYLVEKRGFKMPEKVTDRPAAVKQAIAQIAQVEAATEQAASPRPTRETNETLEAYQRRLAEWEKANKAGAFGSVGAATDGFSKPSPVDPLIEQYGEQPTRPGDARYVQIPTRDASGTPVSAFVGNAFGSGLTTDSFAEIIQKLVASGELSNLPLTNEKSLQNAAHTIATDGVDKTLSKLQSMADAGTTSPEAVAEGILLYRFLLESAEEQTGDVRAQTEEMAANLFVSLKHLATAGGRATQLFSLFRQMSPDGQTRAIAEEIERYVARMKRLKLLPQDYVLPSLSSENPLFREFADASNAERKATTDADKKEARRRMAKAEDDIYKFIAAQIPATPQDKWDAWRHMSMLGNVKTQARNFLSTAAFMPYRAAKQAIGSIIEKAIPREQRTKSVVGFSAKDRELLAWAKQDRDTPDVDRALRYTARLGETPAAAIIEDNRTIYKQKQLEQVRKFIRSIPAKADLIFKRAEYASALAGFLKARGYTAQDLLSVKVPESVLNEGRQYAVDEAMKATFNDINALSDAAAKMRFSGEGSLAKVGNTLLQGAAPYRRTTANLAVRGVEYSPAGLLSGLWDSTKNVKAGKITAAQAIDKVSAGLTGSTALVLGVVLAGGLLGLRIRGGHVPDDEKEAGSQEYSLEFSIGGKTYSYRLDWIGPAAVPLFIGANLRDTIMEAGEDMDASLFAKAVTIGWSTVEPIIDISVLSAIGDALLDAKYAPDGLEFPYVVANLATSYFTQGVPQMARQLANAIPANERETKITGTDAVTRSAERMLGNLPVVGQFFKTDKLDEQGNPTPRGSLPERLLDSFVNPGKVSEVDTSEETRNALQIKKTVSGLDKAFDNLTAAFRSGVDSKKAVSNLDAAYTAYKQLSTELQAQIREEQSGQVKYLIAARDAGLDTDDFVTVYQKFYEISNGEGTASKKAQAWAGALQRFRESGLISQKQKSVLQDTMLIWQTIPAKAEKYNAMTEAGLSASDTDWIMKVLDGLKPEADYSSVRPVQQVEAIAGSKLTEQQQTQIMDVVLDDAAYAKYLKILDQGYSNDDYAAALRIYLDSEKTSTRTKKEVIIREYMDDLDLSRKEAEALYKLYNDKA